MTKNKKEAANKVQKPIYRTESVFTSSTASKLEQPHHDFVVQLLVDVLTPIGQYRSIITKSSKSSKKRKRHNTSAEAKPASSEESTVKSPEIQHDLLVGFNTVTRHLEKLSTLSNELDASVPPKANDEKLRHVAAVFLLRPLDDLIYSHLPALCHTASLASPELPATRLVLLDPSVEKKLASALAQSPNVSVLALLERAEEDSDSKTLIEYIRREVAVTDVPWLRQATEARWLGTKVDVV